METLLQACEGGDLAQVRSLLSAANAMTLLCKADAKGRTLLLCASHKGNTASALTPL